MPPRATFHGVSTAKSKGYQAQYGTPAAGTLTAMRGARAHKQIGAEVVQLCKVLESFPGGVARQDGVPFRQVFDAYVDISNKVAGVLLRARKHGVVSFPGEMLFQGVHDGVPILQLRLASEVQEMLDAAEANMEWGSSLT
jgi:hypothetical protein